MRILIVSQYFAPERTAASFRLEPFASGLARRGHRVEVVCEVPAHPEGVVHPGFRGRPLVRRDGGGFRVTHVRTWSSPSKGARHRLASYAGYAALAVVAGSLRRRPDVILASSPPLSVGAVGAALATRHRVPWVFDVRDLWPEVAVALGEVSDERVIALARRLERRLYGSAASITVPTEAFREAIHRVVPTAAVRVVPNGTTREWMRAAERPATRSEIGVEADAFLWTYAGNVGLSQDLGVALEAASRLGSGFELLILGDGASRQELERRARELPEGRVVFRPPVDPHRAARLMAGSDALLVPLAEDETLARTVPVKLYDACATGRPVIVAAPGEARRIAEQRGVAVAVPPGDPDALAAAVRELAARPERLTELASAGRRFAVEHLREEQIPLLERVLEAAVAGSPAS